MPFASHLNLFPSSTAYESSQISDAELAQTLALWTNVDFSYDDGGIGLDSGKKLFGDEHSQEHEGREEAGRQGKESKAASSGASSAFDLGYDDLLQQQQQPQQIIHSEHDPLDPFGFITSISSSSSSTPADLFPHPLPSNFPSLDAALPLSYNNNNNALPTSTNHIDPAPTAYSSATKPPPSKKRALTKGNASSSVSIASAPTPVAVALTPVALDDPVSIEDDKRRRNTAASARFRQKKKEREQALEKNSKELQARCALLEREVESLRQENTWLKGLVVGGSESTSMPEQPTSSAGAPTGIDVGAGQKRKRDEEIADLFQDMA